MLWSFPAVRAQHSEMSAKATLYPLGGDVFCTVRKKRGNVSIHIAEYGLTKKGRVESQIKNVSMDLKMYKRLVKIQKHLTEDFETVVRAPEAEEHKKQTKEKKRKARLASILSSQTQPYTVPRTMFECESGTQQQDSKQENCIETQMPVYTPSFYTPSLGL